MTDLQALHDSTHTMVMGVLNITEDSSSDGGLWLDPAKAAQHGRDMMAAGADIIDIGAESTRPGAKRVAEADELARITGAVKTLIPAGAILSIDTTRASVAAAALSEGAQIINDVPVARWMPNCRMWSPTTTACTSCSIGAVGSPAPRARTPIKTPPSTSTVY